MARAFMKREEINGVCVFYVPQPSTKLSCGYTNDEIECEGKLANCKFEKIRKNLKAAKESRATND